MTKDMKAIATTHISNTAGIAIYAVDEHEDRILAGLQIAGEEPKKPRWYNVYTTSKGAYFSFRETRFYLGEFMRMDFP